MEEAGRLSPGFFFILMAATSVCNCQLAEGTDFYDPKALALLLCIQRKCRALSQFFQKSALELERHQLRQRRKIVLF